MTTADVWVVIALDPDEELCDVAGVRTTEAAATTLAAGEAIRCGYEIDRWVEVGRTPDQAHDEAYESLPQNGLYFRIERHHVYPRS